MNELKQMEKQMGMQMEQNIFNQLAKEHHDEIMNFRRNCDRQGLMELQDQLVDETKKRCKEEGYPKFTDEQVKTYTEMGGTPFLDNQYTVFGEVEEGLDVVEKSRIARRSEVIVRKRISVWKFPLLKNNPEEILATESIVTLSVSATIHSYYI